MNVPATFGEIAKVILMRLHGFTKRVDVVCDSYLNPYIKDAAEHGRRGSDGTDIKFIISGHKQKLPKKLNAARHSAKLKTSLLRFLVKEWRSAPYIGQIRGHILFVGLDDEAYQYEVKDDVDVKEIPTVACQHD